MNINLTMNNNYFEVIRGGTNTTFQDEGRDNLYHIGIPFSGAMDRRNFYLGNKLVNNNLIVYVISFPDVFSGNVISGSKSISVIILAGNRVLDSIALQL